MTYRELVPHLPIYLTSLTAQIRHPDITHDTEITKETLKTPVPGGNPPIHILAQLGLIKYLPADVLSEELLLTRVRDENTYTIALQHRHAADIPPHLWTPRALFHQCRSHVAVIPLDPCDQMEPPSSSQAGLTPGIAPIYSLLHNDLLHLVPTAPLAKYFEPIRDLIEGRCRLKPLGGSYEASHTWLAKLAQDRMRLVSQTKAMSP